MRPNFAVRRAATFLLLLTALVAAPRAETNSAAYKFEGNKWLSLDLSVGDVRAETIRFEWPATMMHVRTGYKAAIKVANGSSKQAAIGLVIALYDKDKKLIGAGTAGTTLGTVDPGTTAQFTVDFKDVTARLEEADQFAIALEIR